jgi:hypothetical protein
MNEEIIFKMASCDRQGTVYIGEREVYRVIPSSHTAAVIEILGIIGDDVNGVIETCVCDQFVVPLEAKPQTNSVTLMHRKIARISYPHEWCAKMLQDAALFHLELSERLLEKGVTLKDAHPWNILFEKGQPIFIDFTSLVTTAGLFAEEYLDANLTYAHASTAERLSMIVYEIYKRMFQPYFINPLMFYQCGERDSVRLCIENTTLNASTSTISLRECVPKLRVGRSMVRKLLWFINGKRIEKRTLSRLHKTGDLGQFYSEMRRLVQSLRVTLGGSSYSEYYQQKGEQQDLSFSNDWNAKQKVVHNALNSPSIRSVLDVACNTGWFALLAEKLGKEVVAFDIDEGCIETLYSQVKHSALNILPLVMNFTELTRDRYSIHDGQKVLINAEQRLRSDSVLALGIVHHLALGLGLSFDKILDSLDALCDVQLIVEFVEFNDDMIQGEPSFFPAYYKNKSMISGYNIQEFIYRIESRGFKVTTSPSHPSTRTILVCERQEQH